MQKDNRQFFFKNLQQQSQIHGEGYLNNFCQARQDDMLVPDIQRQEIRLIQEFFIGGYDQQSVSMQKKQALIEQHLKFLKGWLFSISDYRKIITQMVNNLINYDFFFPKQVNSYMILENQAKNYAIFQKAKYKIDNEKQEPMTLQFVNSHLKNCSFMRYDNFKQIFLKNIINYQRQLPQILNKPFQFSSILSTIIQKSFMDSLIQDYQNRQVIVIDLSARHLISAQYSNFLIALTIISIKQRLQQMMDVKNKNKEFKSYKDKIKFDLHRSMKSHEYWISNLKTNPQNYLRQATKNHPINFNRVQPVYIKKQQYTFFKNIYKKDYHKYNQQSRVLKELIAKRRLSVQNISQIWQIRQNYQSPSYLVSQFFQERLNFKHQQYWLTNDNISIRPFIKGQNYQQFIDQFRKMHLQRTNQILRYKFIEQLQKIAGKLLTKDKQNFEMSGLYAVDTIDYGQQELKIKLNSIDPEKNAIFTQFKKNDARLVLLRLFLPRNSPNIKFTQQDLRNVIKLFIKRIKIGFYNATKKEIKLTLILLRHLILDLNQNKKNYPNSLPFLNILQAFIDSNTPNSNQLSYILQFYLNERIKKLKLDYKENNKLICTIFLLSLVDPYTNDFLGQVYNIVGKWSIQQVTTTQKRCFLYIKQLLSNFAGLQKGNHGKKYVDQISNSDIIQIMKQEIIDQWIHQENLKSPQHQYHKYILKEEEQLKKRQNQPSVIQNQKPKFLSIRIFEKIVVCLNEDQLSYQFSVQYRKMNAENVKSRQQEAADKLLRLTYQNFLYLLNNPQANDHNSITQLGRSIMYVTSIYQQQEKKHEYFNVIYQRAPYTHTMQTMRQYYTDYFDQPSIYNMLIKEKCQYVKRFGNVKRYKLIKNLFNLQEIFQKIGIEPIIFNIGQIDFIVVNAQVQGNFQVNIVSVYNNLSFFRVTKGKDLQRNIQLLRQIFEDLHPSHKLFTQNCLLNVWNNQPYSSIFKRNDIEDINTSKYVIGSLGFVLCLLSYQRRNGKINSDEEDRLDAFLNSYLNQKKNREGKTYIDYKQLENMVDQYFEKKDHPYMSFLLKLIHPDVQYRMSLNQIFEEIRQDQQT